MPRGRQLTADPQLLEAALEGLELQKQRLEEQIRQVRTALGRRSPGRPAAQRDSSQPQQPQQQKPARRKRVLSAEARKRIAAAQKKRWANYRKENATE